MDVPAGVGAAILARCSLAAFLRDVENRWWGTDILKQKDE